MRASPPLNRAGVSRFGRRRRIRSSCARSWRTSSKFQSRKSEIVPYLGGGYGGKVYPKVEPITVALAQKAGRPVRVVLSREEVFYTITKHAAVISMKTGVKKDGVLVARECEIHLDTGAYAEIGPRGAKKSGYTAAGPYKIPNLKIDSYSVYTNKPPAGAFRGFGVS